MTITAVVASSAPAMSHLVQFLLLLSLVIAAAKLAGVAATRLGQPAVFGGLLVGLLLGPTVLDVMSWPPSLACRWSPGGDDDDHAAVAAAGVSESTRRNARRR